MSAKRLQVGEKFYHRKMNFLLPARDEYFNLCYDNKDVAAHLKLKPRRYVVSDEGLQGKFAEENKYDEFVVIMSNYGGGGTGMGPHDVYPNAWQVYASPVKNPNMLIKFHQETNCFYSTIPEVKLL